MTDLKPAIAWPGVVAELHRNGMTLTELAKRNGRNPNVFRQVKSRPSFKDQKIIADFIGQKPEDIWPTRYPKGKPRVLDTAKYPPSERKIAGPDADRGEAA